jgi:hypothetical protein
MNTSPEESWGNRLDHVIEHVRDMVAMFRRRGEKTDYALPKIAELLGTKHHRVRSLFYAEKMWALSDTEANTIERRFSVYLDREIALSIEYTENLRAKKRQLDLRLECKNSSQRGSGFGSTGSLARLAG